MRFAYSSLGNLLPRIGYLFIEVLLALVGIIFILGHVLSVPPPYLNPINNYISQYAASSSARGLFDVTIILCGVVFLFESYALLGVLPHSRFVRLGCLALTLASIPMIFVAVYPTYPVSGPAPNPTLWQRFQHLFHQQPPPDPGIERIAHVHDTMIKVSSTCLLVAIVLLGFRFITISGWRRLGWLSLGASPFILALFVASHATSLHGLWQRIGFGLVFLWLVLVIRGIKKAHLRTMPKPVPVQIPASAEP
jgi:hypothetical protein